MWVLTDGCELNGPASQGVTHDLIVPPTDMPGGDMFYEANRWDQRVHLQSLGPAVCAIATAASSPAANASPCIHIQSLYPSSGPLLINTVRRHEYIPP